MFSRTLELLALLLVSTLCAADDPTGDRPRYLLGHTFWEQTGVATINLLTLSALASRHGLTLVEPYLGHDDTHHSALSAHPAQAVHDGRAQPLFDVFERDVFDACLSKDDAGSNGSGGGGGSSSPGSRRVAPFDEFRRALAAGKRQQLRLVHEGGGRVEEATLNDVSDTHSSSSSSSSSRADHRQHPVVTRVAIVTIFFGDTSGADVATPGANRDTPLTPNCTMLNASEHKVAFTARVFTADLGHLLPRPGSGADFFCIGANKFLSKDGGGFAQLVEQRWQQQQEHDDGASGRGLGSAVDAGGQQQQQQHGGLGDGGSAYAYDAFVILEWRGVDLDPRWPMRVPDHEEPKQLPFPPVESCYRVAAPLRDAGRAFLSGLPKPTVAVQARVELMFLKAAHWDYNNGVYPAALRGEPAAVQYVAACLEGIADKIAESAAALGARSAVLLSDLDPAMGSATFDKCLKPGPFLDKFKRLSGGREPRQYLFDLVRERSNSSSKGGGDGSSSSGDGFLIVETGDDPAVATPNRAVRALADMQVLAQAESSLAFGGSNLLKFAARDDGSRPVRQVAGSCRDLGLTPPS